MMQVNILEYFQKTCEEKPWKTAVIDRQRSVSFSDLKSTSILIANRIVASCPVFNRPVAVYLPKSIELIASDIAIIYSGNIFMNLDVNTPIARVQNILDKIQPSVIISDHFNYNKIKHICAPEIVCIDIEKSETHEGGLTDKDLCVRLGTIIDTDPFCIINTSGSTGTPKGVVLNHRSFIDFTEWAIDRLNIREDEIIGSLSPVVFDIYCFELCLLMAKSATILLIQDQMAAFPVTIIKLLSEQRATLLFWVPTIMVNIANMDLLSKYDLTSISKVFFAGEVFPTKQYNYWHNQLPGVTFTNLYGPIEITLDCTYFTIDRELDDGEQIPIGFPCRNTDIILLNEENGEARPDEVAELCVRGTSLAMGYYNDPEKTSLAFIQNPLNKSYPEIIYRTGDLVLKNERGELIFKGRKDTQIKHLGYRIEMGEIEHILINSLKIIDNGCVVYDYNRKELVLIYESVENISFAEIRKALSTVLPKYMIPGGFKKMDALPRNANGKIDRFALNLLVNKDE